MKRSRITVVPPSVQRMAAASRRRVARGRPRRAAPPRVGRPSAPGLLTSSRIGSESLTPPGSRSTVASSCSVRPEMSVVLPAPSRPSTVMSTPMKCDACAGRQVIRSAASARGLVAACTPARTWTPDGRQRLPPRLLEDLPAPNRPSGADGLQATSPVRAWRSRARAAPGRRGQLRSEPVPSAPSTRRLRHSPNSTTRLALSRPGGRLGSSHSSTAMTKASASLIDCSIWVRRPAESARSLTCRTTTPHAVPVLIRSITYASPGRSSGLAVRVVDHALEVPVASVAPGGDRGGGDGDALVRADGVRVDDDVPQHGAGDPGRPGRFGG